MAILQRAREFLIVVALAGLLGAAAPAEPTNQAELARLFAALHGASGPAAAQLLETQIRGVLLNQASPATQVLMRRALQALHASQPAAAAEDLADVVVMQPDYAPGWTARAAARATLGDSTGAIADLAQAVRVEPRDFDAWELLSRIAERRGDWQGALDAWRHELAIDPMTQQAESRRLMLQGHLRAQQL